MNTSPNLNKSVQWQFAEGQNGSSIIHQLSAGSHFRDSEDLHTRLLSAAQAEHTKVRESAIHILKQDQIRDEKNVMKLAYSMPKHIPVENDNALEASRNKGSEQNPGQSSKPTSSAPIPPSETKMSSLSNRTSAPVLQKNAILDQSANNSKECCMSPKLHQVTVSTKAQTIPPNFPITERLSPSKSTSVSNPSTQSISSMYSTFEPSASVSRSPVILAINKSNNLRYSVEAEPVRNKRLPSKLPSHQNSSTPINSSDVLQQIFRKQSNEIFRIDQFREVHANMKLIRKRIENHVNQNGKPSTLKTMCNKGRREITKALGQLIVEAKNTAIVDKVMRQLRDALLDKTEMIEVSNFTVKTRRALSAASLTEDGVDMNGDKLPLAFIYLLAAFCKAICAQLVREAALKPQAASPIGILAARVFSDPRLHWRGESLIDMLIAKISVACPVLFGVHGDESTGEGKLRIGWRRINGKFISEQAHFDRMSGIAAGFAAISLRDFSKTRWKNPYPVTNYWVSLSAIINTPSEKVSPTQYVVLKSLIENNFSRFIMFYGDMAIAVLQGALVEFPRRGREYNTSARTLEALCLTLQREHGLILR